MFSRIDMKKWMIVLVALSFSFPLAVMAYDAFVRKAPPEDLAPETKPHVENK
ncbi:MAG: hypothetical protein ACXVIY_00955 [Mucilaginibacter sp.]